MPQSNRIDGEGATTNADKEQLYGGGIHINLSAANSREGSESETSAIPNENYAQIKSLDDLAMNDLSIDHFPVVKEWRRKLFDPEWIPEVCDELPRLLTEFLRRPENEVLPATTRRAKALHHVFTHKKALVRNTDLLPGETTTSFVGPVMHMDMSGYCIWPELDTISTRAQNPFKLKPEVAKRLNEEIFPYWLQRRPVQEAARYSEYDTADYINDGRDQVDSACQNGVAAIDPPLKKKAGETPKCQELFERVAFYLSDKATAVSHTTPDFGRVLKYGIDKLIVQLEQDIEQGNAETPEQVEFLQGVISVYQGVKVYTRHLAKAAEESGNMELAGICQRVPAQPAETFAEAVTVVWICYHLLLQENTNFGLSLGRMDQTLNPYYLKDWQNQPDKEAKRQFTVRAVELICHLFLRCSDHVPLSPESA